jgi:hypothetical protein
MRLFLRRRAVLFVPGLLFLACIATAIDASAQTNRRRSIPIPAPTATPFSEPEIISRADEIPDENSNSRAIRPDPNAGADSANVVSLEELGRRIKNLEAGSSTAAVRKPDPDEKQKRLLLNLDILTRAEQRSESLRKQVFDMMEKESNIKTRIDSLDYDLRPEMIERNAAMVGTLRPEEIRESRAKSLQSEKANLQNLLTQIQSTRASLEISLGRADELVEKLRTKFEKEIDASLEDDPDRNP